MGIDKKLVMICPLSSQPRIHKRASILNSLLDLKVLGFRRRVYEENAFGKGIDYESLGYLDDGKYYNRFWKMFKAIVIARRYNVANAKFYALSIDCLFIAKMAGFKAGYYEVGDLRSADSKNSFFVRIEKYLLKNVDKIIITSEFFYESHFKKLGFQRNKFLLLENKLLTPKKANIKTFSQDNKIRIGVIGLLRYKRPLKLLIDFVETFPENYEILCFGDGSEKHLFSQSNCESIKYFGAFKNPDDLESIYKKIDLNYVVYENSSENVRLALPNKLYESMFYNTPIVAAEGTALSSKILDLDIGKALPIGSASEFESSIKDITTSVMQEWRKNLEKVSPEEYLDNSKTMLKKVFEAW